MCITQVDRQSSGGQENEDEEEEREYTTRFLRSISQTLFHTLNHDLEQMSGN